MLHIYLTVSLTNSNNRSLTGGPARSPVKNPFFEIKAFQNTHNLFFREGVDLRDLVNYCKMIWYNT